MVCHCSRAGPLTCPESNRRAGHCEADYVGRSNLTCRACPEPSRRVIPSEARNLADCLGGVYPERCRRGSASQRPSGSDCHPFAKPVLSVVEGPVLSMPTVCHESFDKAQDRLIEACGEPRRTRNGWHIEGLRASAYLVARIGNVVSPAERTDGAETTRRLIVMRMVGRAELNLILPVGRLTSRRAGALPWPSMLDGVGERELMLPGGRIQG